MLDATPPSIIPPYTATLPTDTPRVPIERLLLLGHAERALVVYRIILDLLHALPYMDGLLRPVAARLH